MPPASVTLTTFPLASVVLGELTHLKVSSCRQLVAVKVIGFTFIVPARMAIIGRRRHIRVVQYSLVIWPFGLMAHLVVVAFAATVSVFVQSGVGLSQTEGHMRNW